MMDNNIDNQVDRTLEECIFSMPRKSFFLFAGAGSGKTHSLILLLKKIRDRIGKDLLLQGKNVAVITYTNAATNEIISRLDYTTIFHVSTIHSFVWNIIKDYQTDIKEIYCLNIVEEIRGLEEEISKILNKTTKTYLRKTDKLQELNEKLQKAQQIEKFVYNPNGNNPEYNALKHSEVIQISAQMISEKAMLKRIIAQRYPILLIDESQDTKNELVDAFFDIQKIHADIFTLGLLGDQKQRIYTDGKEDIEKIIPDTWAKPVKKMNYRSSKRIIQLANSVGKDIDLHAAQVPRTDANDGLIRLFIIQQHEGIDKEEIEKNVMISMAKCTGDEKWSGNESKVKILTLEHMMAARRLGFDSFYAPFSKVTKYQMNFLQGTVPELEFLTKELLPLAKSMKDDGREALEILKRNSPLLSRECKQDFYESYLTCREKAQVISDMVNDNKTIREIISAVLDSHLLNVPEVLEKAIPLTIDDITESEDEELIAWINVMNLSIDMVKIYDDYVNQKTKFDTHQGVKGLEFERVMVIIDDSESKGHMFSYDKLFGLKDLSDTDKKNIEDGKETSVQRTQRLFYVTCTRAKDSLAVVMYTNDSEKLKTDVLNKGWFNENEIVMM